MKDKTDQPNLLEQKLLKASEVIQLLRIARSTFYEYVRTGQRSVSMTLLHLAS
jgi:predicted DNA-binding transcriptional regulator AlpA